MAYAPVCVQSFTQQCSLCYDIVLYVSVRREESPSRSIILWGYSFIGARICRGDTRTVTVEDCVIATSHVLAS